MDGASASAADGGSASGGRRCYTACPQITSRGWCWPSPPTSSSTPASSSRRRASRRPPPPPAASGPGKTVQVGRSHFESKIEDSLSWMHCARGLKKGISKTELTNADILHQGRHHQLMR